MSVYQYLFEPEIHKMLVNFYHISGLRVGIHAPDMTILTEYPEKSKEYAQQRFCDKARYCSETFTERCANCDKTAFAHIRATKKAYIYRCHLGFMEALIPIKSAGEIICALMIGQVRTGDDSDLTPKRMASFLTSVGVPDSAMESLTDAYARMSIVGQSRFEAFAYFLEICAQSIYDNRWIRRDEKSLTENFTDYVRANLYNEITVADAANALNISTSHLFRILKRDMNTSFTHYLNHCRVEVAMHLLRTTQMTVGEIAIYLCYSDPTYFMRVFKKHTGMTCTEYRTKSEDAPPKN